MKCGVKRRWLGVGLGAAMLAWAAVSVLASGDDGGGARGLLYLQMDLPELALHEFEKAAGAGGAAAELLVVQGLLLQAVGRPEQAAAVLKAAEEEAGRSPGALSVGAIRTFAAEALARRGLFSEAAALYREALAAEADLGLARLGLARTLAKRGELAEAAAEFQGFLSANPDDADALADFGELLVRLGKTAEARSALEEALRLNPGLTAAREALRRLEEAGTAAPGSQG